jgi:hypothetical protein
VQQAPKDKGAKVKTEKSINERTMLLLMMMRVVAEEGQQENRLAGRRRDK